MKLKLLVAATSAVLIFQASAALMRINNLVEGAGDTLYADKDNVPMSQGVVTIGYFPDGVNPTDIPSLLANIGSFTVIDSQTAGTHYSFSGLVLPGYAGQATAQQVPGGPVTGASPLLGRTIYSIVSNAPSLAAATSGNQFAMVSLGVFLDDVPSENTYISNPAGSTVIIGSFDTTVVEGENYNTLKMNVFVGPANPYATWATAAGLDGTPGKENGKADDPDGDGRNNNYEFAFNGDPLDGSDNGMVAGLVQDASAPAGNELTLVVAVRDGVTFTGSGTPVVQSNTTPVDGLTYTIEGSLDLAIFPGSDVSHVGGPSATAPVATGLPDVTGTAWKYHTFKLDASEGLGSKGFLRAKVE
jgi:hypothetical protein